MNKTDKLSGQKYNVTLTLHSNSYILCTIAYELIIKIDCRFKYTSIKHTNPGFETPSGT